jgi:hypothetical protein
MPQSPLKARGGSTKDADRAEEYAGKKHVAEYTRRMDERSGHVVDRTDERFYSLEKRMERGFAHVGQRFDDLKESFSRRFDGLERRMDQLHADRLQVRNWLVWLFGLVVFGFIGSIVLVLFRDVFKQSV